MMIFKEIFRSDQSLEKFDDKLLSMSAKYSPIAFLGIKVQRHDIMAERAIN